MATIKTMLCVHALALLSLLLCVDGLGFSIADILWNPKSPMFNPTLCRPESRVFNAKLNDIVPILCPNMDLNNGFKTASMKLQYNYNIFMTESREAYEARNATMATHIKDCTQKISVNDETNKLDVVVVKHEETLREYAPMGGHTYQAGKTYYFFTTSDGTEASLKSKKGKNNSMGFEVHICGEKAKDSCKQTERINLCIPKHPSDNKVQYRQSKLGKQTRDSKRYFKNPMFGLAIFLAFALGTIFGVCALAFKRRRDRKEVNIEQDEEFPIEKDDENANGTIYSQQQSVVSNDPLID